MRLLKRKADGDFVLKTFTSARTPAYAILSHTWNQDNDKEVNFQDLCTGAGKDKAGYSKLEFCAKRAALDGLQYFWVDTCCIDKSNAPELAEAITSMFKWYYHAACCYVYLADVSVPNVDNASSTQLNMYRWEPAFRMSRWFNRGCTLQELIAPRRVLFFSREGTDLGDKASLEALIMEITGIAKNALRGYHMSAFGIEERLNWAAERNTKVPEDSVYCLLGIFDISMPLIYGEGKQGARTRLEREISHLKPMNEQHMINFDLSYFPQATAFLGRDDELRDLHTKLSAQVRRSIVVVHGLGGIGKTQFALAYARRHRTKYSAIFWADARDQASIKKSFSKISKQILRNHPLASDLSASDEYMSGEIEDQATNSVMQWLQNADNTRWLLIYDGYDNSALSTISSDAAFDISDYLPKSDHGSIIVASRASDLDLGVGVELPLGRLATMESINMLGLISRLGDLTDGKHSNHKYAEGGSNLVDVDANKLVEELDGLPLAISAAGTYLRKHKDSTMPRYLEFLELEQTESMQFSQPLRAFMPQGFGSTWQSTLGLLQVGCEAAVTLLKFWAVLDHRGLWYEMLDSPQRKSIPVWSQNDSVLNPEHLDWYMSLSANPGLFSQTIQVLHDLALLGPSKNQHGKVQSSVHRLHPCVHRWLKFCLTTNECQSLIRLAIYCIVANDPASGRFHWWSNRYKLENHLIQIQNSLHIGTEFAVQIVDDLDIDVVCSLVRLYICLDRRGEAVKMSKRKFRRCKAQNGDFDPQTIKAATSWVESLTSSSRRRRTPADIKNATALCMKYIGHGPGLPNIDSSTWIELKLTAYQWLYTSGAIKDAVELGESVLSEAQELFGPSHWLTISAEISVAHNLSCTGKPRDIYDRLSSKMIEWEDMFPIGSPQRGIVLYGYRVLAYTSHDLEDYRTSLTHAEIVLREYEEVMGSMYRTTVRWRLFLGWQHICLCQWSEALCVFNRHLELRETLGMKGDAYSDGSDVIEAKAGFGLANRGIGNLELAKQNFDDALRLAVDTFGVEHAKCQVLRDLISQTNTMISQRNKGAMKIAVRSEPVDAPPRWKGLFRRRALTFHQQLDEYGLRSRIQ